MSTQVLELGEDTFFAAVEGAQKPVIVDFWAPWCGPCRMISPLVEEMATEHADAVTVAKVNVDDHPNLASRFGVMSIPSVLRFDGGKVTHTVVGAMSKSELVRRLGLA